MSITSEIKDQLLQYCFNNIQEKIALIESNLASIIESRNNETKSSVGDKYETGRAMMQIEEGKNKTQLGQLNAQKNDLSIIGKLENSEVIGLGSLILSNKGIYFISIGLGKVKMDDGIYFCISNDSPISNHLKGKRVGDEIIFNGNQIKILELV